MSTACAEVLTFTHDRLSLLLKPPVHQSCAAGLPFLGFLIKPEAIILLDKTKRRYPSCRTGFGKSGGAASYPNRLLPTGHWPAQVTLPLPGAGGSVILWVGKASSGTNRVNRGSLNNSSGNLWSTNRNNNNPNNRNNNIGFRVVLPPSPSHCGIGPKPRRFCCQGLPAAERRSSADHLPVAACTPHRENRWSVLGALFTGRPGPTAEFVNHCDALSENHGTDDLDVRSFPELSLQ